MRLLVETLIVAAIIGPAAYFWYWWQVKRTADAMLERAAKLVEEKDDAAAAQYYFQYLKLRPDDADVQVLLAESYDRAAKDMAGKPRAVEYYYQALGVAPADKQHDLHRRLAELLIELRRFVPAEEEARELLKRDPNDPQGWRLRGPGACTGSRGPAGSAAGRSPTLVGEAVRAGTANSIRATWRSPPPWPASTASSRNCSARSNRPFPTPSGKSWPIGIMDAMVAANPEGRQGAAGPLPLPLPLTGWPIAKEDLAAALKSNPNDLEVVLQAAQQAGRRRGIGETGRRSAAKVQASIEQARKHYNTPSRFRPRTKRPYVGLGELYAEAGQTRPGRGDVAGGAGERQEGEHRA